MPLGIERLNARRLQPNPRIVFIKPLPGPDAAFALDYLERIAAICNPIMKANHLAVMTLEEHSANLEFVGRNFNAGEVIQLVLKSPYTGHWLPFQYVQMVMMHELSHCKEMNHSRAFWKVRDQFAGELRALWERGYTGENLWSRGKTLLSGEYVMGASGLEGELQALSLCGGTFRSGGRKRKRRGMMGGKSTTESLTYAERQQRRIARKFGTHGLALGGDEVNRVKLEAGKRKLAKPKVAGSTRGRELRAAAALARFEKQPPDISGVKKEETDLDEGPSGSETGSENDDDNTDDLNVKSERENEAVDLNGQRMLDAKGRGMIKVCDKEDNDDEDVKREMRELQGIDNDVLPAAGTHTALRPKPKHPTNPAVSASASPSRPPPKLPPAPPASYINKNETKIKSETTPPPPTPSNSHPPKPPESPPRASCPPQSPSPSPPPSLQHASICPICTTSNPAPARTCTSCSHVLDPSSDPHHWRCRRETCREVSFINAGDCGVCGVCGHRRGGQGY